MNRIIKKINLADRIALFEIQAPAIARHLKPGQFVIVRPYSDSERIPLTLVKGDAKEGTVTVVVQAVGRTTNALLELRAGEYLADMVGPLGEPVITSGFQFILGVAGGVGVAEIISILRGFKESGARVAAICGARSSSLVVLKAELRAVADEVLWATDDGTFGFKGTVIDLMKDWYKRTAAAEKPDLIHVIGPIAMMRAAAELTKQWQIKTRASVNPIMVDGTGMCGSCRVTVDGKPRFACVDGPEFDAWAIDFTELLQRNKIYWEKERFSKEHRSILPINPPESA